MISIQHAVSELERLEELKQILAKYYTLAIRSVAEYAVDVEPRHATDFRAHLQTLEALAACAVSEEEYAAIHDSFRGELRGYHAFTSEQLRRMRAETAAAAQTLQSLTNDVVTSNGELETKMKEDIAQLESAALSEDVAEIRKAIRTAVRGLGEVCQQLTRSKNLTIAQLQDELRALHQEMSQERRSIYIDATSGAWIRPKLDERVERLLREGSAFSILFVWAGLRRVESQHSKYAVEEVRKELVRRMEQALKEEAFVARWSEEMFAAVIEAEAPAGRQIAEEVRQKLAPAFGVQEDGVALTISVEIRTVLVERLTGGQESGFHLKLGEVGGALSDRPGAAVKFC